jgi:hypothetical protein
MANQTRDDARATVNRGKLGSLAAPCSRVYLLNLRADLLLWAEEIQELLAMPNTLEDDHSPTDLPGNPYPSPLDR